MRFLEGVGGDAGGSLGTTDNQRRADGPLPLPEQKYGVSLIYPGIPVLSRFLEPKRAPRSVTKRERRASSNPGGDGPTYAQSMRRMRRYARDLVPLEARRGVVTSMINGSSPSGTSAVVH